MLNAEIILIKYLQNLNRSMDEPFMQGIQQHIVGGLTKTVPHQIILNKLNIQTYSQLSNHQFFKTIQLKIQRLKQRVAFFEMTDQQQRILPIDDCRALFNDFKKLISEQIITKPFYLSKDQHFMQIHSKEEVLIYDDRQGEMVWRKEQAFAKTKKYVKINLLSEYAIIGEPENSKVDGFSRLKIFKSEDSEYVQLGLWRKAHLLKQIIYNQSLQNVLTYRQFSEQQDKKEQILKTVCYLENGFKKRHKQKK